MVEVVSKTLVAGPGTDPILSDGIGIKKKETARISPTSPLCPRILSIAPSGISLLLRRSHRLSVAQDANGVETVTRTVRFQEPFGWFEYVLKDLVNTSVRFHFSIHHHISPTEKACDAPHH